MTNIFGIKVIFNCLLYILIICDAKACFSNNLVDSGVSIKNLTRKTLYRARLRCQWDREFFSNNPVLNFFRDTPYIK